MKKTIMWDCELSDCSFQECHLPGSDFQGSSFRGCHFPNADVQASSFRRSHGCCIDPRTNKVRKAIFDFPEVLSMLECFGIIIDGQGGSECP